MKTNKKNIKLNRRSILCWLLVVVLLAAIILMQFILIGRGDTSAAEERAKAAVHQVAAQFHQEIDSDLRLMNVAAAGISENAADNAVLLKNIAAHASFDKAEIIPDGASSAPESYIRYEIDGVVTKINIDESGVIRLRVPAEGAGELSALLSADAIQNIMLGAYPEAYGYALYNAATGAYLYTNIGFEEAGYYDTLHAFNDGGRTGELMLTQAGQAHIDGEGGNTGFYIAHQPSGIAPWSIALFIPESILGFDPNGGTITLLLSCASAVLLFAVLAIIIVHFARRVRSERRNRVANEEVSACMLQQATEDAQIGIYIYGRRRDAYRAGFDGLHFASNGENSPAPETFESFASLYGLDDQDAENLYNRIREIKAGERSEISLNCASQDSERVLRFELRCPVCDGDCVIISVRDATLEAERADNIVEEERFRRLMLPKCSAVWQVNVSRNRWYLTDGKAGGILRYAPMDGSWRDYTADLEGVLREYIHPKDYPGFAESMSIEGLNAMIRSGRPQATLEYRANSEEGYQWHRMLLRIFRSMDNGDLLANLYVLNVDAEKNAELERQERARILQQTLTALGGIYNGLYYVDLESDMCYTAKAHAGGAYSRLTQSYKAASEMYLEEYVHPDDRETMRRVLEPYHLRRNMTEASHLLRLEYRRRIGDHFEPAAIVIQAARFENGTIRDIVLAMRKYGNEKKVPESV